MDLMRACDELKAVLQHSEMTINAFGEWRELLTKEEWTEIEEHEQGGKTGALSALVENLLMLEAELVRIQEV